MVKDQHPQAAKEAAENVLPTWFDAFKVLLDLDPQQDISGEHWDGLEIRIQIFRVRTSSNPFPSPGRLLFWLGRTDSRHDTYILPARRRAVFTSLCRLFFASPTRALPDIRAVLSHR
jgi:hypothetical protein